MSRLDKDMIGKIQAYPEEVTNTDVGKDLGIDRRTVAKYRKGIGEALTKKEEKKEEKLNKSDKKKLDLLEHYSEKEIKEMLAYIANSTKKEVDEVLSEPGHLRFGLVSDTHFGAKGCAKDELGEFYDRAKDKGVECFVHCGDIVDGCNVYKGQQFEQSAVGFEAQLEDIQQNYPNVGLPTYFIGGNHEEKFLKENGVNICKAIEQVRQDLIHLGFYDARLNLNGIAVQLHHGGGSLSYAKDYKMKKYLDSLPVENQPDIFALGHFHTALYDLHRGIHGFMPGSFLKTNLLAKRFNLGNTIGGRIIDIEKDDKGKSILNMEYVKF